MRLVALGLVLIAPLFAIAGWVHVAYKDEGALKGAIVWTLITVFFGAIAIFA